MVLSEFGILQKTKELGNHIPRHVFPTCIIRAFRM